MSNQMSKNFLLIFFISIFSSFSNAFAEEKILITVNQFVNHTALDAAYDGMHKALTDRGILPDRAKLIVANAQGNITNSVQISKHQASLKPRFMVAIATPAAQTNMKAMDPLHTTLAFVAVTDPVAANLVRGSGVIGVSDSPPIKELLEITKKTFPDKKIIGVIYNAGEINSVKMTQTLEIEAPKLGFEVKKISVNNSSDIKSAMNKLTDMVDIIYLPQDNTIVSALDSIVNISKKAGKPVIANDPSLVDKGVDLALGTNYFKSGQQLGNMIADMIEEKEIAEPITSSKIRELRGDHKR
jgi:putative ABC transport system substrate-binding protein